MIYIVYTVYIIYICITKIVNLKIVKMSTMVTKRKIIDLKPETEKNLRLIAVNYGQNLKSYIESVLDELANEDEVLIALSSIPEANEILSESEKIVFINSLKK